MSKINKFDCVEDGGVTLMDRVLGNGGTPITQASLSSITLKVYECADEESAINAVTESEVLSATLTIASHVYDTLQTAAPWTAGGTGYNFRYDAAAACFPTGGKWYRFEFKFTPVSGAPFWVRWYGLAEPVATS